MTAETRREMTEMVAQHNRISDAGPRRSSVVLRRTPVSLDHDPLTMISCEGVATDAKRDPSTTTEQPVVAFDPHEYSHHHQAASVRRRTPNAIVPLKGMEDDDDSGCEHDVPPRISFAALKPTAACARANSAGGSLYPSISGGRKSVRHEALEELAANVRDLRAEVHGRPSLCERRFSSLRRSRSCNSLLVDIQGHRSLTNISCRDLMAEVGGIMEALDKEDGGSIGRNTSGKSLNYDGGRDSFASFSSNGPLGGTGGPPRGSQGALPRFGDLCRYSSGRSASFKATKNQNGSTKSIEIERMERAPQTPHEAAEHTIELVYSLVSALYGLIDMRDVPLSIASAILDHTPAVDLAFGRIKPLISALAFESSFDESDHSNPGSDSNASTSGATAQAIAREHQHQQEEEAEDEESAELRRQLSDVSRLLDALAGTVRRISEVAPSVKHSAEEFNDDDRDNTSENAKEDAAVMDTEKAVKEAECIYVTLLELLGLKCSELSQSNVALISDYMMDYMHAVGHSSGLSGSRRGSGLLFSRRRSSRSSLDLFSLEDDDEEGEKAGWELSRSLRGNWLGMGHEDKIRILEKHECSDNASDGDRICVDPDLLRELSLLVLSGMGWVPENWKEAVDLAEERTLLMRVRDGESPSIGHALTLCRLGDMKVSIKKYGDALASYEEALIVARIHCDDSGPVLAAILEAIGNVHRLEARYDQADSSFHEALSAIKNGGGRLSSGDDSAQSTAEALISLLLSWSHLESDRGEREEALALLERRLAVQRDSSSSAWPGEFTPAAATNAPDDGPDVADTLFRMGSLCMDAGMDGRAGKKFAEALRIRKKAFGPDDSSVGDALFALGLLKCAPASSAATPKEKRDGRREEDARPSHGSYNEALELLWGALRIRRLHRDHLKEAETLAVLGKIHRTLGHHETAASLYGECLEIRVEHYGKEHREVADVHVALGYAYKETKNWDEALQHFRAAISISENIFGETDDRAMKLTRLVGNAEFAAGNLPFAKKHFKRFLRLKRQSGNDQGLDCVEALHVLGKIHHAMGNFDEARDAYTEAQKIYAVNNHAARRMSVGRELIESLRNLDAGACSPGDAFDENAAKLSSAAADGESSNPVRSFIMRVGRSMSMEHAFSPADRAMAQRVSMGHGWKSSMDMSSLIGRTRSGSSDQNKSETMDHERNGSMGHGNKSSIGHELNGSFILGHGSKSSLGHGRSGGSMMGHGGGHKSSMDMSSSSFGSGMGFGRKSSMGHSLPRKSSMDMSASSFGSGVGFGKRSSMDHVPPHSSSMDHAAPLPPSCPAVASGQKLSGSQTSGGASQQPMMAKDHLWASQIDFSAEDLKDLFPDKNGEEAPESPEGDGPKESNPPDVDSPSCGGRSSPSLRPESNRNPSIMTAMRAANTSVRNKIIGIRDEAVQPNFA